MDVSEMSDGLAYETDYITHLRLAERLVIIHNGSSSANETVDRLRREGINVPVIPYDIMRLRHLKKALHKVAAHMIKA
jgi:hypothetical protein